MPWSPPWPPPWSSPWSRRRRRFGRAAEEGRRGLRLRQIRRRGARALERLASTVADTVRAEDASGGPSAEVAALLARLHDLRSHQLSGELQRVHAGAGDASTFVGSRDRAASQLLQLGALAPAAATPPRPQRALPKKSNT